MVLPNNMLGVREQINTLAGNNAASKAIGAKRKSVLFNASYADNGRVSFVESSTRMEISERGALQKTGNHGDISLSSGNGMFIFKRNLNDDSDQGFVYKGTQSLRIDKDGNLSTRADGTGYKVMGFKYNNEGQLSQVTSLLSSMEAINVKGIVSAPEATTEILVNRLTLDAKQEMLKGAGVIARPNKSGANSNLTFDKIIMPEASSTTTATSSLKQGDRFTFAASGTNVSKTFEYGGVSISKDVSKTDRDVYGATSASTNFNIAAVGTAPVFPPAVGIRNLITDQGLTIQIGGGAILQFQANQTANAQERKFNSFSTLKDAINTVPGLSAEIRNNRLLIAASDLDTSNQSISFANLGGSNMVEVLGLANVPAVVDPAVTRFASLGVLKEAVNLDGETTLLSADRLGESLDIHALLATSNFTVTGNSTGATTFATAVGRVSYLRTQGGDERGSKTIQITSPEHGLKKGDFINFSGAGTAVPGKYMVGDVTTDTFNLSPRLNAGGAVVAPGILASNGTWQKVPGEGYAPFLNATVTANAANVVAITAGGHALLNNDIIYISGLGKVNIGGAGPNVTIPDGYYTVTIPSVNGGDFDITVAANAANAAGDPVAAPFTFQKVGRTDFATAFNPTVIRTANGSRTVQIVVPRSSYNLTDDFKLTGLLNNAPVVVNGVTIRPDTIYTVTAKGNTAAPEGFEYISFDVPAADGIGGAAPNPDATYTEMGADFKMNDYSRSLQYLNIDPKRSIYEQTYNADDDTLSLSNLDPKNEHRKKGRVFHHSTAIYDSLGVEHKITMNFARLDDNDWAVEIAGVADKNGDFDFVTNGREDGLIAAGVIGFDNGGNFASSNVPTLNITWTNDGSAPSSININWDDLLNGAGIKQYGGERSVADSVKPNGHSAGTVVGFEIASNGDVYFNLSNNQDPLLGFKLALAMFDNIDGMVGAEDGFFRPTGDSGSPKIRFAGENGAPTVISKTIETSNIDPLSTILELNSAANDFRANVAITTLEDTIVKEAISKIGSV